MITRAPRSARLALLLAAALALVAPPAPAGQSSGRAQAVKRDPPPQIRDVRRTRLSEAVRITIELDREVPYRSERLDNPPRLVFDFLGTRPAKTLVEGTLSYPDDVVRHVRIGRHPNDVTRVVLDLAGVRRHSVFALYDPYRLVVDCVRDTAPAPPATKAETPSRAAAPPSQPRTTTAQAPVPARASSAPAALPPAPPERVQDQDLATVLEPVGGDEDVLMFSRRLRAGLMTLRDPAPASPPQVEEPEAGDAAGAAPRGEAPPAPPAAAPAPRSGDKPVAPAPLKNGFSLARQLGLGATRIVIDPGHGGRDPGAQARGGSEGTITLDIALRLEKLLKGAGLDPVLTRRTDRYVALEERTELANRVEGDLFLSIHVNASRNTRAQGVETYVLNFASNPEAEEVAARENASSERTMSSLNAILQAIALNSKLDESRSFASNVQNSLVRRLRGSHRQLKDLGVKQAPFVVLIGAGMPSVLVEVSFLSHQQEGRLLKTASYRQKVAEALLEGIRGYQKSLKRALSVSGE